MDSNIYLMNTKYLIIETTLNILIVLNILNKTIIN